MRALTSSVPRCLHTYW